MKKALLSVFLLLCSLAAHGEKYYYQSNALGMEMGELPPNRKAKEEYFLETERNENTEVRVLFSKGREIRRWEIQYYERDIRREEKELKGAEIQKLLSYDRMGRLTEEQTYRDGKPLVRYVYASGGKGPQATEAYDASNALLYRETYALTGDGSLRQVVRTYPDGAKQVSSYSIFSARLLQESYQTGEDLLLSRFDEAGHLLYTERWNKETLLSRIRYAYHEGTSILKSQTEEVIAEKKLIISLFDAEGNLASESTVVGEKETENSEYRWESGKKKSAFRRSDKGQEEWGYEYDKDGVLTRETYFLKGRLEKATYYTKENEYREEIYRNEVVSVILYYRDNEKIREEYYQDGKLVRERDLVKNGE
jgi:hypothetical protein